VSLSPRARIARILLRLALPDGSVPGNQEDLGRLLGMARSSVRRALSSLIEIGAVTSGYGTIAIRDRTILEKLVREA
jgi:DNA-binding IclR family transcriptional regulator